MPSSNLSSRFIATPRLLLYVTLSMLILIFAGPNYAASVDADAAYVRAHAPGVALNGYKTEYAEWNDPARQRTVPVKMLIPEDASSHPVILFSHGLGGSREGGKAWGEYWASHGYMVVHIQHPGSDEAVWKDKPMAQRLGALKAAANAQQLMERARDVRFVLDELQRRHADFPMADLNRIGMSGHSFGASTTQGLAGERYAKLGAALIEPRIKAALAFSPSSAQKRDLDESFGSIAIPFMSVTGTRDGQPLLGLGEKPETRVLPFEHMPPGNKYLLVLNDADHMLFNGVPGRSDFGGGDRTATLAIEPHAYELVEVATLAYWDATLKNNAAAQHWLADGGFAVMLGDAGRFAVR